MSVDKSNAVRGVEPDLQELAWKCAALDLRPQSHYHWPKGWEAVNYAGVLFALLVLAILVVWGWWHFRPCDGCGEYRTQCRCKAPGDYS